MIRIFSWKSKKIKKKILRSFIDFYEKQYLFFSEIPLYEERKENLIKKKRVDCQQFATWIRENYPDDVYSKCYMGNKKKQGICCCRTMYGGLEYIYFAAFREDIIPVIEKAVSAKADYLVLDLRNNCGGSLDILRKCLPFFLKGNGTIEIKKNNTYEIISMDGNARAFKKIFLMVNENTMSCAEILMMVLYENMENVYIIGGPTYGKDKGQITMRKEKMVLSITHFYWYVSGRNIEEFWKQSGNRIVGVKEKLSEQEMIEYIYINIGMMLGTKVPL